MIELAIRRENALFLNGATKGSCGMVGAITEKTLAGICVKAKNARAVKRVG